VPDIDTYAMVKYSVCCVRCSLLRKLSLNGAVLALKHGRFQQRGRRMEREEMQSVNSLKHNLSRKLKPVVNSRSYSRETACLWHSISFKMLLS